MNNCARDLERMKEVNLQGSEAVVYVVILNSRALENRSVGWFVFDFVSKNIYEPGERENFVYF
jgi:hypothetical protein